jgi:hypothetical protein
LASDEPVRFGFDRLVGRKLEVACAPPDAANTGVADCSGQSSTQDSELEDVVVDPSGENAA